MAVDQIAHVLDLHGVPYYIERGRIFADTCEAFTDLFSEVADLTGYTVGQLFAWLGY